MDYSIGSLSDLITGSNTPNKPKVIERQIPATPKSPKNKNSPKKKGLEKEITAEDDNERVGPQKKRKSRNIDAETVNDEVSPRKKRKSNNVDSEATITKEDEDKSPLKRKHKSSEGVSSPKKGTNAERRVRKKEKTEHQQENPEQLARTVFVGNVPITTNKNKLFKFFSKFGPVDSVRIRGVPVANPNVTKKVAVIKKEFHPERKSFIAYVRFQNVDDAVKATESNGILFKEHHLRIQMSDAKEKPDESKAIFVGNLSFNAEDEELWKLFEPCGEIDYVRIVRDGRTGIGKGFGYVNFKTSDGVQLALEMENVKLNDRELRISLCNVGAAKKNKKKNQVKQINKAGKPRRHRLKNKAPKQEGNDDDTDKKVDVKSKTFQGTQFVDKKKKKKLNKSLVEKKKMIKKLAPKVK